MTNGQKSPDTITLEMLRVIEEDDRATQRAISRELGIALGLTNAYLKKCIRNGFIKVRTLPANRYAYRLTPRGFAEKSRLTAEYLSLSFNFYRASREQSSHLLSHCREKRWTRIALAGCGDLAEIVTHCARDDAAIDIVGIVDTHGASGNPPERFAGLPVVHRLTDLAKIHAVIVTDIVHAQRVFEELSQAIPPERVLTAQLLKVSRTRPQLADD